MVNRYIFVHLLMNKNAKHMKAKIIAVANHKGGVGKTSSVASIGAILAARGYNTLIVDLDTQANLTRHFMEAIPERIIYHAIRERRDAPIYRIREHLDMIPSGLDMAGVDVEMMSMKRREYILSDLLRPVRESYDVILLDCPPSLGLITLNALTAAEHLMVPMKTDLMSTYGLVMMDNFCNDIQDLNRIDIDLIFFNGYEKGQKMTDAVEKDIRSKYGDKVMRTVVRKNNDIAKASFEFTDVVSAYPASNGAHDFQALVDELEEREFFA